MIPEEAIDAAVDALVASKLGDHKGINGEEFVEAARAALEAAAPYLRSISAADIEVVADMVKAAKANGWDEGHERGFWNGRLSELTVPYDAPDPLIGKQDAEANNPYRSQA